MSARSIFSLLLLTAVAAFCASRVVSRHSEPEVARTDRSGEARAAAKPTAPGASKPPATAPETALASQTEARRSSTAGAGAARAIASNTGPGGTYLEALLRRFRAESALRMPIPPSDRFGPPTRNEAAPGAPVEWFPGKDGRPEPFYPDDERSVLDRSSSEVAEKRSSIIGRLERAGADGIAGYAYDWATAEAPLDVEVFVDGVLVTVTSARLPRTDPNTAYTAAPLVHGFFVEAPVGLLDGERHVVRAVGRTHDQPPRRQELAGSPRTVGGNRLPTGRLVVANTRELVGWAADPDDPARPVTVDISLDGTPLMTVEAGGEIPQDLRLSGHPSHWYRIPVPPTARPGAFASVVLQDVEHPDLQRESPGSPRSLAPASGDEDEEPEEENRLPYGAIAFVNDTQITGWAVDPDAGETPIEVDVYLDGRYVGRQRADRPFTALVRRHDVTSPNHLFVVDVPLDMRDGETHTVGVVAINEPAGANRELAGSPTTFRTEISTPPVGYIDVADHRRVAGWAYDPDLGPGLVDIEVWVDGSLWQTVPANVRRNDLVPVVCPEPEHGFSVEVPEALRDGGFHTIRVFARDASGGPPQELRRSPRELGALRPWLGVQVKTELGQGLRVLKVEPGSPAATPGEGLPPLRVGDLIRTYHGTPALLDAEAFAAWVQTRAIGEVLTLEFDRPEALGSALPLTTHIALGERVESRR